MPIDDAMRSKVAEDITKIYKRILTEKATELWEGARQAWEIHRFLLNQGVNKNLADEITLQVTGVDFTETDSWGYS